MSVLKITSALFYDCRDLKTMQSWVFEWPQWGPTMGGLGPGSGSSTHSWVVSKTIHVYGSLATTVRYERKELLSARTVSI